MPDGNWKRGECYARPVGSHPKVVTVGETRFAEVQGQRVEKREVKEVRYEDWDGRCRVCHP
jgi:hypothetical protein